ncbi:hypothetical protein HH310_09325 [Actinoplanes sp. TBRC 11911]|uniref:hypothetical protein n=1 Tax=Actinoplanes sp. TBRC 11911 TaxID=2729386 RepID=UPI00145E48BE|nr:hypothetical protein [Actinoplanes sp. TBRC 11911]NMO51389.1 hypothetical protein [Actinoplanes sp. TBRC 11911]
MADRPLELTPEERALFERAETEACGALSFDLEAGLADVRARAHAAGRPFVPRQRSGSGSVTRLRIGAVATIVAALAAATGLQLTAPEDAEPPQLAARPPSAAPLTRDRDRATAVATSRPPSPRRTADSATPRHPVPRTKPAPPTEPVPGPPRVTTKPAPPVAATPAPSISTAPGPFRVRYPATWLTVLLDDAEPQTLNLAQPKIVDDGPVRITTSPTGDPVLSNTAGVLAATIPTDDVAPVDCAAAIEDTEDGEKLLDLRDDRSYCLMTPPVGEEPQTLVRVDVERPDDGGGEIRLCLTAWEATS